MRGPHASLITRHVERKSNKSLIWSIEECPEDWFGQSWKKLPTSRLSSGISWTPMQVRMRHEMWNQNNLQGPRELVWSFVGSRMCEMAGPTLCLRWFRRICIAFRCICWRGGMPWCRRESLACRMLQVWLEWIGCACCWNSHPGCVSITHASGCANDLARERSWENEVCEVIVLRKSSSHQDVSLIFIGVSSMHLFRSTIIVNRLACEFIHFCIQWFSCAIAEFNW